jgi:hypothetical protein
VTPAGLGSAPGIGIKRVRAKEVVTVPGTTTTTALDGEFVIVGNGDAVMNALRSARRQTPPRLPRPARQQARRRRPATRSGRPSERSDSPPSSATK